MIVVVIVTRNKHSRRFDNAVDIEVSVPQYARTEVELSIQGGWITCLAAVENQACLLGRV